MSVIRNFLRNEKIMFLAKVTPFLNLKIANYYIAHPNLKRDSPIINFKIYLLSLQYLRWDYFWLGRHFQIWILSLLSYWDINQKSDRLKVQFWTLEHKLQSFNPPPQKLQKEIDSRSVPVLHMFLRFQIAITLVRKVGTILFISFWQLTFLSIRNNKNVKINLDHPTLLVVINLQFGHLLFLIIRNQLYYQPFQIMQFYEVLLPRVKALCADGCMLPLINIIHSCFKQVNC